MHPLWLTSLCPSCNLMVGPYAHSFELSYTTITVRGEMHIILYIKELVSAPSNMLALYCALVCASFLKFALLCAPFLQICAFLCLKSCICSFMCASLCYSPHVSAGLCSLPFLTFAILCKLVLYLHSFVCWSGCSAHMCVFWPPDPLCFPRLTEHNAGSRHFYRIEGGN